MRNLKKFLALVLAMMMALSLMVTANAADPATPTDFDDLSSGTATYSEAIDVLSALGIIKGYAGTNDFKPLNPITRAEVAALIYRIAANDAEEKQASIYKDYNRFGDVDENSWYAGVVNYCANAELVKGDGTNYAPRKNVTGYEVLAMVLRVLGYDQNNEFTGSGWQIRTASYARKVGLTKNIKEGTLGQPATREVVCEILFQALQAPTVTYNMLTNYTEVALVRKTIDPDNGIVYEKDVYNNLMYANYGIVGKRTILDADNYGRPVVEWVKDAKDDTVENGGKFIVNAQTDADITAAAGNGVKDGGTNGAKAGASYIPDSTPGASYAKLDSNNYVVDKNKIDETVLAVTMTPVYTFYDKMTECNLVKAINSDDPIDAEHNLTEWLNGAKVDERSGYTMDALHTATGDTNPTVGAPGRTTEVYITGQDDDGDNIFVFVYVDTLMGVVQGTTNRTYDTAGHVMNAATLTIKVNETVNNVVYTSTERDFTEYSKGDLILLTTWGGANKEDDNKKPGADESTGNTSDDEKIQTSVPTVAANFRWDNDGSADYTWAVDIVGAPATETFTVNASVGTVKNKTGLLDASGKQYMANIVYLANENYTADNGGTDYYENSGTTATTAAAGETTVPKTATNYGVAMTNARIGQAVTAVLDPRGYVVGLTTEAATTDIGVILGMDSVRIATGKYAVEAEMLMMDGSTKTVRFLHNSDTNYDSSTTYSFYTTAGKADDAINTPAIENCNFGANVLVRIEPYTKEGATYYKVTATHEGPNTAFNAANIGKLGDTSSVMTGVANTLADGTTITDATYTPTTPVQTQANNKDYINDKTKFIIAEYDYRYNQGDTNEGGYTDLSYKTYTGFKNIPTITGAANEILWQKIGNNVFIYPETNTATIAESARRFTLRAQATYAVDETYLVLAPLATYADHATYKVLKDGVETTLEVSNNNITTVNKDIETAMDNGQLIYVDSTNSAGYATSVVILDKTTTYTFATRDTTRTIAVTEELEFAKDGVLYDSTDAKLVGPTAATKWLTVADDCKVIIVNLINGTYVEGTFDSIMQYEDYDDDGNGTVADSEGHSFVYELNQYGYASTIYIID